LLPEPYQYKLDNSEFHPYSIHIESNDQTWSIMRPISPGLTCINEGIPISGKVYNAFGSTEFHNNVNLLLYTPTNEESTSLIETFNDESTRKLLEQNMLYNWPSTESLYKLNGLMVIPGMRISISIW
jgi:hypothetical protein